MKENVIREKSFKFALRIIKLNKYLIEEKREFVLSKQILRSGTAIGALVEEALQGDLLRILFISYRMQTKKQMKQIIG
jgi:four helix bundle protein